MVPPSEQDASHPAAKALEWSVERRSPIAACEDCRWHTTASGLKRAAIKHAEEHDHSTFIERMTITRYSTYAGRVNA